MQCSAAPLNMYGTISNIARKRLSFVYMCKGSMIFVTIQIFKDYLTQSSIFLVLSIKLNTKIQNETLFCFFNWWCDAYLTYLRAYLIYARK